MDSCGRSKFVIDITTCCEGIISGIVASDFCRFRRNQQNKQCGIVLPLLLEEDVTGIKVWFAEKQGFFISTQIIRGPLIWMIVS